MVAAIGKRIALVTALIAASPLAASLFAPPRADAIVAVPIGEFARPLYLTAAPGDTSRVFILENLSGNILIVKDGARLERPFLVQRDITTGGERGLFAMAFHPDYDDNGYFYVSYSREGGSAIRRYRVSSNPDVADTTTGVDVIFFPETNTVHFGGWIGFGPDGYLYIAKGDGAVQARAQGDSTRFGKILRIDVTSAFPYAIPPDNPRSDAPSPVNEFWATGLRNPWRCSFDRETGDFYMGDVGAGKWEEIDFQSASSAGGENYGWPKLEGPEIFDCPDTCDTTGITSPLASFSHAAADSYCAIVGGYVYRGDANPELRGAYFIGDLCAFLGGPKVTSLTIENGVEIARADRTAELQSGGVTFQQIASFGEDARGELYICDLGSGVVSKIVPDSSLAPLARSLATSIVGAPTPNPTRGGCRFEIRHPAGASAPMGDARIYDSAGRLVRTLRAEPGLGSLDFLSWDSRDDRGDLVPSGSYFLRIASEHGGSHKIVVVR